MSNQPPTGTLREFIYLETPHFEPNQGHFPDPYALKRVSAEGFAAATLAAIPPPAEGQHAERIAWMAHRLHELEKRHRSILFVCNLLDWPWIRDAYLNPEPAEPADEFFTSLEAYRVDPRTLIFFLGKAALSLAGFRMILFLIMLWIVARFIYRWKFEKKAGDITPPS